MKYHLKRIVGNSTLTYEELATVTAQIEANLNSRPLCPLTNDPHDIIALTPGHFLIGSTLTAPPEANLITEKTGRLSRWQTLQKMQQQFWKIWSTEYLSRLQQRPKWNRVHNNFLINDMVLIKDEQLPPGKWPLGRITETHPGKDELTRVVTIRTSTGECKRPITKVCKLPITEKDEEEEQFKSAVTERNHRETNFDSKSSNVHEHRGSIGKRDHEVGGRNRGAKTKREVTRRIINP